MAEAAANVEECPAASGLSSFFSSVAAWALMAVQAVADVAVDANTGMSMQIPA